MSRRATDGPARADGNASPSFARPNGRLQMSHGTGVLPSCGLATCLWPLCQFCMGTTSPRLSSTGPEPYAAFEFDDGDNTDQDELLPLAGRKPLFAMRERGRWRVEGHGVSLVLGGLAFMFAVGVGSSAFDTLEKAVTDFCPSGAWGRTPQRGDRESATGVQGSIS